jgi:hypothetical protein
VWLSSSGRSGRTGGQSRGEAREGRSDAPDKAARDLTALLPKRTTVRHAAGRRKQQQLLLLLLQQQQQGKPKIQQATFAEQPPTPPQSEQQQPPGSAASWKATFNSNSSQAAQQVE